MANSLGVKLADSSLKKLRDQQRSFLEIANKITKNNSTLIDFLNSKNIPYKGSKEELDALLNFTELVLGTPKEHFALQTEKLTHDNATQAIDRLLTLQTEWVDLEKELSDSLYIDNLPQESDIKQAILTLREGDAWYRVFQKQWRAAKKLHKLLQRTKLTIPSRERLKQLEQIIRLLKLKEEWQVSPTWIQFLGFSAPTTPRALEGYLELAQWNQNIKIASEDINATPIDLSNFTASQIPAIYREFSKIKPIIDNLIKDFKVINEYFKDLAESNENYLLEVAVEKTKEFTKTLGSCLDWLELEAFSQATFNQVTEGYNAALIRSDLKFKIQTNSKIKTLLGDLYRGLDTDCSTAIKVLSFGRNLSNLNLLPKIKHKLLSNHPVETCCTLVPILENVYDGLQKIENLSNSLSQLCKFELHEWVGIATNENLDSFVSGLYKAIQRAIQDQHLLIPWSHYLEHRKEIKELNLTKFVELLEKKDVKPNELSSAYAYCVYSAITREAFRNIPELDRFTGLKHDQTREAFKKLDKKIIALRGKKIACESISNAKANVPAGMRGVRVNERTEMSLLNHLIPQQRPRMPVRKMLTRAKKSIQSLKPCFMMGPQAVAQYLEPGVIKFDLVIMDEASQLKPEEAIGAIARGDQLVVVGDSKQLPPTSFFSRMVQDYESFDDSFTTTDAESILDVCASHFKPTRSLRWHYRSQHHSLIAFSNHHFYDNRLIVFRSPYSQGRKLGLRTVYLSDAIYENQTNLREAKRVVDAVVEHITTRPDESLGVVTLNIKQRDLIDELLGERLSSVPGSDSYHRHWAKENQPRFIKNLENVQGDERDAIIISMTFGKPPGSSKVRQNFGPISRQGGWRRLNVLFTRAKKSIAVYTSLRPEDIIIDGAPEGTRILRNYLEYARTGSLATTNKTNREPDSDFEIAVMNMLKLQGYEVTPQLGVANYYIDIAVKHPNAPDSYLAAIECDGATYHSALSVRDRDRIRQEIIESLGWRGRIWRIWSTDWFRAPETETKKLIDFLENLRNNWKPEHASEEIWVEEGQIVEESTTHSTKNFSRIKKDSEVVNSALIDTEDDLEIEVGDIVHYTDLTKPNMTLTVQIVDGESNPSQRIINKDSQLAQTLLGAVIGDEIAFHPPSATATNLVVRKIIKNCNPF